MTSEKEALLNFIGGMYGQMKEIDNHIAATGSGAKFGGRSAELKNVFEQVAASPVVQQPAASHAFVENTLSHNLGSTTNKIQPIEINNVAPVVQTHQHEASQSNQLEFTFKDDANSILKDIYNILFDIKKLLALQQTNLTNQNVKPIKKAKKYADCCLCGSKPAFSKDGKTYVMNCTGCGAQEIAASEQAVKTAWNITNKGL